VLRKVAPGLFWIPHKPHVSPSFRTRVDLGYAAARMARVTGRGKAIGTKKLSG
jgi:hypothetical protein